MADEIHEVAAVGFDRVVGQQRVADPRHQGSGDLSASLPRGLQGAGEEGFDLVRGRGVAFEEVAALGHEGRAGRRGAGSWEWAIVPTDCTVAAAIWQSLPRIVATVGSSGLRRGRPAVPLIGKNHLGVGVGSAGVYPWGVAAMRGWNIKRIMFHSMFTREAQEFSRRRRLRPDPLRRLRRARPDREIGLKSRIGLAKSGRSSHGEKTAGSLRSRCGKSKV